MDPTKVWDINEEGNYDTEIDALLANLEAFELDEDLDGVDSMMGEVLGDGIVASDVVNNPSEPEVPQPEVINQFNSPCTDVQIPQEVTSPGTHSIALEPLEQTQWGQRNSTRGGRGQCNGVVVTRECTTRSWARGATTDINAENQGELLSCGFWSTETSYWVLL